MDARRGRPATMSGPELRTSRRAVIVRGLAFWPLYLLVVCAKPEHSPATATAPAAPAPPPPPSPSQAVIAPQVIGTPAPVTTAAMPLATVVRPTAMAPTAA